MLAISWPSQAGCEEERDRSTERRGAHVGGYVLATGVVSWLGLAVVDAPTFWIAQALQTVNAIELGKHSPSLEVAFKIAHALDAPLEEVFRYP